jgi:peptidoglycan-associated lipoprotein
MKKSCALLVILMLAACGGTKRPPAVATSAGGSSGANSRGMAPPPDVISEGPDVQPVDGGGLGQETLSDESGEGGPLADIHFDYDQSTLTDEARTTLGQHASWIQAHASLKISVEGHCDDRGTVEYNLALGEQRARAAYDYLVSLGVPKARLNTVSYGKERPLDTGTSQAAWARNRRAHFAVSR